MSDDCTHHWTVTSRCPFCQEKVIRGLESRVAELTDQRDDLIHAHNAELIRLFEKVATLENGLMTAIMAKESAENRLRIAADRAEKAERRVAELEREQEAWRKFTEEANLSIERAERRVAELEAWREAVIDALVVDFIYTKEHDSDPRKAINDLMAWEQKIALDPAVSTEARALRDTHLERAEQAERRGAEWEWTAKRYAQNADYWRGRVEKAEQDAARWRYLSERMTPTLTPTGVEAWQLTEYILGDDLDAAIDKAMKEAR